MSKSVAKDKDVVVNTTAKKAIQEIALTTDAKGAEKIVKGKTTTKKATAKTKKTDTKVEKVEKIDPKAELEAEIKTTAYPLTDAQTLHYYTMKFCPAKQILNIGTGLFIKDLVELDVLKEAIYKAYERWEVLRVRFAEDKDGNVYQYIADKEDRDIETVDLSDKSEEEVNALLKSWTEQPLGGYGTPRNKIVLINLKDNYRGVYLCVDHMTLDAYGIIAIMGDVVQIYASLKFGLDYPKPVKSYIDAINKDFAYKTSKAYEADKEFWKNYYGDKEPIYTDIRGSRILDEQRQLQNNPNLRAVNISTPSLVARHQIYHLEADPTRRLLEYSERNGVPFLCVVLMGIRSYLSKMNNFEQDISFKSTVARRATLLEKKSGGTRVHFYPFRTIINDNATFLDGVRELQQKQNLMFQHANYSPIAVLNEIRETWNLKPGETYESLSVTYQPFMKEGQNELLDTINFKSSWYPNGVAGSPLYLTILHNPTTHGVSFMFEVKNDVHTEDDIEKFYYYLCKIIFMGVEHPDMTIGEIIHTV